MPHYVQEAQKKLNYHKKVFPQHSLHKHNPIKHGVKGSQQRHVEPKKDHLLQTNKIEPMQPIVGIHQYYARAIDNAMLASLNEVATTQAKPTEHAKEECQQLQDYAATHQNMCVRYCASDMMLWVEIDAAYLVFPKAKNRIAGHFHLYNYPKQVTHPTINGAMHIMCKALRHVVSSSAEAGTVGVFMNVPQVLPIRHALMALDDTQPPTPLKTDNSTIHGFFHNNMQQNAPNPEMCAIIG